MEENEITIRTGVENMDLPVIHRFLQQESYWAQGIGIDTVVNSLRHSYCIGAFVGERQVGFARLITDYNTFGWLADVFVVPEERGKAIGKHLMGFLMAQPWTARLRRIMLVTKDAHELYRRYGFREPGNPQLLMEVHRPDIHRQPEKAPLSIPDQQ
ncbi:GNAT family N-acetyltransferase [Chitinophaga sp. 212800010-3]|uniref:GNAT family N-acetyltransferase n=1 Tax=unclassified Chitinophaga TaxID=2619133 RepID=UPI002DEF8227|nr:N-acetyltransferase domain-containing protein [Chitinophaga sp. 212800010-3]